MLKGPGFKLTAFPISSSEPKALSQIFVLKSIHVSHELLFMLCIYGIIIIYSAVRQLLFPFIRLFSKTKPDLQAEEKWNDMTRKNLAH